ncbi:MAG: ABC transporter ATP-binding protein [Azospirillaceae bacterium]|nr:ABC transporter ATP-binding protein [Azospirillaceae bacterium]
MAGPKPSVVPPSAVSLRHVSKSYDGRRAVCDLALDVTPGEFLAIVGPSGSGKTTIMRVIGGFETPDTGTVSIAGTDVTLLPAEKRNVNTVFQGYALFPHLSVIENVAYGPRMRGCSRAVRRAKAQALLERVRLGDAAERRPHELSGGMQQRVALARALANDPAVLLLDEPLGALDRKLRDEMQRELRRVQTELAATFIYVTHDQDEAFGMADRLAVMRDGRFEQIGAPAVIYDQPANAWVALFVGSANKIRARVDRVGGIATLRSDLGPIEAGYLADGLVPGDSALVVVRPEATYFGKDDPAQPAGANRLAARLVDAVAIGPSLRLRAVTAGGVAFESIAPRNREFPVTDPLVPGDPVVVSFDAVASRAYHDETLS